MKLSDFYFEEKALVGKKMPILLPNGEDSGEWLNVVNPDADAAVKAGRAFIIAYRRGLARFEELEKAAKETGDYTEYNMAVNELAEDLNRQLAAEVVNGWSFDEPFSKDAFNKLLDQFKALGTQVAAFHNAERKALQEK